MEPFRTHRGLVAPLARRDVDTDQIIPKQFLKRLGKTGYQDCLFYDWRHPDAGGARDGIVLDRPEFAGASVLVAGANFGCGSSREHAAWALEDYGFRAVIAPSFADIFRNNAVTNGLLPVVLPESIVATMASHVSEQDSYTVEIDLEARRVRDTAGLDVSFEIDDAARHRLLNGLDDIGLILQHEDAIARFEAARG